MAYGYKARLIPGTVSQGKTRGGGSESIEWVSDGPMVLFRDFSHYTPGIPLKSSPYTVFCTAPSLQSSTVPSDNTVRNMGDSAITMSRPASPSMNLLTSAGELASDGVPSIPDLIRWRKTLTSLRGLRKGVAKDFVAWNFAWLPLESEIRGYYKRVIEADKILKDTLKVSRNNLVRVGHSYPIAADSTASGGTVTTARWKDGYPAGGTVSGGVWQNRTSRVWFEGKYLYFPPVSKSARKASDDFSNYAKEVLGLQLTPEVLWNLSPWSWFSDWLTNTDVIMASVSDLLSDGMVPVSAFVMSHTRREAEKAQFVASPSWSPVKTYVLSEVKKRFVSTPYLGFGGTGTLSGRQLSILAALGLSK